MTPASIAALFALGLLILIVLFVVVTSYNAVIALRQRIDKAWSNIDVVLKQRHDQLPALVSAVRGVMAFEEDVLTDVARARAAYSATEPIPAQAATSERTSAAVRSLFAVVERYPDLKSQANVLDPGTAGGQPRFCLGDGASRATPGRKQDLRTDLPHGGEAAAIDGRAFDVEVRLEFEAGQVQRTLVARYGELRRLQLGAGRFRGGDDLFRGTGVGAYGQDRRRLDRRIRRAAAERIDLRQSRVGFGVMLRVNGVEPSAFDLRA